VNSSWFLNSLPDASGKSLLRKLQFGYMLSPMVAYTSRIIMQAIPARVIQLMYTGCILSMLVYSQSGYHLVYDMDLSLVGVATYL